MSLLGIKRVVVAVNKMDLVDYSHEVLRRDRGRVPRLRRADRARRHHVHPAVGAARATTSTQPSDHADWYDGPTLIGFLETVPVDDDRADSPFRMPVQWVNRPNLDFRGFSGTVVGGSIRPGDPVRVLPAGTTSTVDRIVTMDGDLDEAIAGQSVTLTLADEIDASRGDLICRRRRPGRGRRPVRGARRLDARGRDAARAARI